MSYQPLARKYRPVSFKDLVGQEGVTLALANSIKLSKQAPAIIFSGIRGIGKTTLARVYAKALNCEKGPTPEPCGTCESCVAITTGNHEDVLEIDGASHTSVDDVRALKETIAYVPQRSKYKVYIIDEVHMLSQSAFNALLKTLEEPPSFVIFVFATTELKKIPATILSRCQTYILQKFSHTAIQERLKFILEQEKIPFEDKALFIIAKEGRGSMRDALTFLDQCIALSNGQVTMEALAKILPFVPTNLSVELLASLVRKDAQAVLKYVHELTQLGADLGQVCESLAEMARHAMVIKAVGISAPELNYLGLTDVELQALEKLGKDASGNALNTVFRTLAECRLELDGSELDRYVFENNLLEWCLSSPPAREAAPLSSPAHVATPSSSPASAAAPSSSPASHASVGDLPATWKELVDTWKRRKPLQARILEEAQLIHYSPEKITVAVPANSLAASKLLQRQIQLKIAESFKELFGFAGDFSAEQLESTTATPAQESLLVSNDKEKKAREQSLIQRVKNDPLTKNIVEIFDAEITKIEVENVP